MSDPEKIGEDQTTPRVRANTSTGLPELFGVLPATRTFSNKEQVRSEIGKALGKRRDGRSKIEG